MIPAIALMIGAYITTRMVSLIFDKKDTGIVTTILAAGTILVTLYSLYTVFSVGIDISSIL